MPGGGGDGIWELYWRCCVMLPYITKRQPPSRRPAGGKLVAAIRTHSLIHSLPVIHSFFGTTHQWQLIVLAMIYRLTVRQSYSFFTCKLSVCGVRQFRLVAALFVCMKILAFSFFSFPQHIFRNEKRKREREKGVVEPPDFEPHRA